MSTGKARAARLGNPRASSPTSTDRLRALPKEPTEQPVLIATLRVRVPADIWTGGFSRTHPHLRMEVLNRTDLSVDTSVSDYWISGHSPPPWAEEIAANADVLKVEVLAEVGGGCIYRVTYRNPPVVYQYRRLGLPLQFPLRIQNGIIAWEVVARRQEFEELLKFARQRDPQLQISSIRRRVLRSHMPLLTPSQQELLHRAMAAGYFAVPRAISLTALAKSLGRSKSTISEAIAVIERRLLESSLQPSTLVP